MRRTIRPVLGAALAVGLLAGCGSGGAAKAAPSPSRTAATYGCLSQTEADKGSFGLPSSGVERDAYFRDSDAGHATTAVVFSHQNGGSLCDWYPYLAAFTKAGYAVLPFTSQGEVPEDIHSAEEYLKGKGVTTVALVGASKGGTASLVAGSRPGVLPVPAVVSLSGPEQFGDFDGVKAVTASKAAEFFAAEEYDQPFADNAGSLHRQAVSPAKQVKLYSGANHGALLLRDGALPDVLAFLAKYAPVS
ncbi:alpha/beta hydrolase [Kitasatospora sp. MMS16-BH015]|uniref:hypothetical protein n=1 Tax=Kitasatospora sp. MMS16-BH015 TaxID=2018025 RepID=UPI000CA3B2AD|nr:hypothetical protein [Kitasatospora sp. MMS16-BH015]AUG77602.1 alpha/beta hydrolase [Kitasatospora sp. MMS16-BH015]